MTLLEKLTVKAACKYPIYQGKFKNPDNGHTDCMAKRKAKERLREGYIARWLLKYRKRYERMYGNITST